MWQQQQGNYHYAFNFPGTVFGDQATWELDEFGFLQNPGVLNLYPGSTENTKNTVIGQEEDYPMLWVDESVVNSCSCSWLFANEVMLFDSITEK